MAPGRTGTGRALKARRLLPVVLLCALPLAALAGCPGEDSSGGGAAGTGGGSGSGGSAGDAGELWDPVWHETKQKTWETVGPGGSPDCGPGCRMALNEPLAGLEGFVFTSNRVLATGAKGVAFAEIGATTTAILPHDPFGPEDGRLQLSAWGDFIGALRSFGIGQGQVEVVNVLTGETKVAFKYTPPGEDAVYGTALNSKYVFWQKSGIWSRNLHTGEVKQVVPSGCYSMCASDDMLFCDNGKIYAIDPDTTEKTFVDTGGELQTDGACSPDRKQYAWIDYRDPPGPGASKSFGRSGGEVYVYDLATNKTRRVTFDSPGDPMGKVYPAVSGALVVWSQPPDGAPRNPDDSSILYPAAKTLGMLDLNTGERCRLLSPTPGRLTAKAVYGRRVVATWLDKTANEVRLVDLNLDDPGLQWACEPTPGWKN